jgi:sugar phosphate isomerase/epimerase
MSTTLRLIAIVALAAVCSLATSRAADPAADKKDSKELVGDPKAYPGVTKPKINDAAIDKAGFRLGVQAYTFREMSLYETLDTMKYLGIHYVELYGGQKLSKENPKVIVGHDMPAQYIDELLAKLKEANVTAVSYGVTQVGDTEASARKVFDWAKKMGLENVVSEPKVDLQLFAMLDRLCNEYQINLAMHDHPKPSTYWNPETVLKVSEGRSKRIGSCSDTGHWYRSGLVPVDCIKQLNGRVIELHLKDLNEKKQDVPWGTGVTNAKGIMEALAAQKPTHKPVFFIEYETSHGTDLANNVGKCCENFSKYCEEMTK